MRALEPDDPRSIGAGNRRYKVLARIGSGGMGVVYFGRSMAGRAVAIKLVHAELAEDAEFRERFRREARLARAVGGAFTAPVLDAAPDAPIPWLVTEFLPSVSLGEAVRDAGPLPAAAMWPLAAGIAEALAAIHRAGIAHRDLKPANVLLTADGPRVIDFGIARAVDAATVTRPGVRAGTPGFMSPEQVLGAPIGPASDVFSFGATLAYAATGTEPFGDGPWHATMLRVQSEPPRLDGIADDDLRELIASCLNRDPGRRPTAAELNDRLATPPSTAPSVVTPPSTAPPEGVQLDPAPPGIAPPDLVPLDGAASDGVSSDGAAWLPFSVMAEIRRRASEAENPPVPATAPVPQQPVRGPRAGRRRVLLTGAAAAVVLALAAVVGVIVIRPDPGGEPSRAGPSSPRGTPVVRSAPLNTRTMEFYVTGDVRLASMTYTVNGRATTLKNVKLPWRTVVPIPALPQRVRWRFQYRHPPGEVRWRLLVNGFETASGHSAAAGRSGSGGGNGAA